MAFTPPPANPSAMSTAPSRGMDNATFNTASDNWMAWLSGFVTFLQSFLTWAMTWQSELTTAQADVTTKQNNAAASAVNAAASAAAAATTAAAAGWLAGTAYALNTNAISQIDFQTYRRKIAGTTATDPKNDQVNWTLLNPIPVGAVVFMQTNYQGF